ncbi:MULTISPECIES: YncE family protein [Rhizobium]|uniref:DNA-binding beta-propeller fold protein YncE n=1 Tax=Rhizobium paranaense TaxID=1650438 RepID=A0A7W8XY11_9HYPH|nr:YncE family protein [Rhizobium paranaense]MBB5577636.1 DNA-binding beta-propeller fold protein YncE [Rhizobium paranaense]
MKLLMIVTTIAATFFVAPCQAAAWSRYSITKSIPLGAPDSWDYLTFDALSGRVYIAHGDRVSVVDGKTGAILGNISDISGGTHATVVLPDAGKGFTDDGESGEVVEFDLATMKVIKRIQTAVGADGIIFDSMSRHLFVVAGDSGLVTIVDPAKQQAVATIPVGEALESGVSGNNGKLYIDGSEKNEIVRIDVEANKADAHWPIPGCVEPRGMAIDFVRHRLFSSCANQVLAILDADSGREISTLPIGEGSDAVVFDAKIGRAYSSNRDGTISIVQEVSPDQFEALPPIHSEYGARTMTIDPVSGRIYTITADINVNKSAALTDYKHRYSVKAGSARLLFLDPK